MPVLITGGTGFVGLALAEALLHQGAEVTLLGTTAMPARALAQFEKLPGRLHVLACDVRDRDALRSALSEARATLVIHAAAVTAGPERERRDFAGVVDVNIAGTLNLLEAARAGGVRRIVHASTGAVYGRNAFATDLLDEEHTAPAPETLYAISKHAAEQLALRYRQIHGLDVVVARFGPLFGPWEFATGVRDTLSPVLQATTMAREGRPALLPREGRKDWIYAADLAEAVLRLLALERPRHAVYNIGTGRQWTLAEWCARLEQNFMGFSWRIVGPGQDANVDLHGAEDRAPLAIARLQADIRFQPRYGLDEAFDHYLANIDRYAP